MLGDRGWIDGVALGVVRAAEPVGTVGWGLELADLDNDGWVEIVQASGPDFGTARRGIFDLPDLVWQGGPDGFEDVTAEVGLDEVRDSYGTAAADFDGDGRLDLVVAGRNAPASTSIAADPKLGAVRPEGPPGNTDGFGVRAEVTVGERTLIRELYALQGQSQGPSVLHFGLGEAEEVDRLRVVWPTAPCRRPPASRPIDW